MFYRLLPSQLWIIRIYNTPLGAQEHIDHIFHTVLSRLLRSAFRA